MNNYKITNKVDNSFFEKEFLNELQNSSKIDELIQALIEIEAEADILATSETFERLSYLSGMRNELSKLKREIIVTPHINIDDKFDISVSANGCLIFDNPEKKKRNIKTEKNLVSHAVIFQFLPEDYQSNLLILKNRWRRKKLSKTKITIKTVICLLDMFKGYLQCKLENWWLKD